jgi:hypothetical protein
MFLKVFKKLNGGDNVLVWHGMGQVAGFCEKDNKNLGSTKFREFLELVRNY